MVCVKITAVLRLENFFCPDDYDYCHTEKMKTKNFKKEVHAQDVLPTFV